MQAKRTIPELRARKGGDKAVCVTAYDAPTAALLDEAGVDIVLVGDSVGNVQLGYDSTLPVTMEEMLHHLRAVRRGLKRALLVADMPFLSYQPSPRDAILNAGRFIQEGADAVKLEGGLEIADAVTALIGHGIPVMGHVGLMPQRLREYGGYGMKGKDAQSAYRIWQAAQVLDRLGVFSLVLESVPDSLARFITKSCAAVTIGIGAGPNCDGQVLVFNDVVGLTPKAPRFAKAYARGLEIFRQAVQDYARDVRAGSFPAPSADLEAEEIKELEKLIKSMSGK
jgi:3-methyl-2-oxobutanoate hydroxymethyltransferase